MLIQNEYVLAQIGFDREDSPVYRRRRRREQAHQNLTKKAYLFARVQALCFLLLPMTLVLVVVFKGLKASDFHPEHGFSRDAKADVSLEDSAGCAPPCFDSERVFEITVEFDGY